MAEVSATKPITPAQVRAIHVALATNGIEDADYRRLLAEVGYGASTCKDLTRRQASNLLARLGRTLPNPPGEGRPRAPRAPRRAKREGVAELPSPLQRTLIEQLSAEVEWQPGGGFGAWCERSYGFARPSTKAQAAQAIEGLKAVKRRQGRRQQQQPEV